MLFKPRFHKIYKDERVDFYGSLRALKKMQEIKNCVQHCCCVYWDLKALNYRAVNLSHSGLDFFPISTFLSLFVSTTNVFSFIFLYEYLKWY